MMKRVFLTGVLVLGVLVAYSFAQMGGFGSKQSFASDQEAGSLEKVSAEDIYPLFVCPCCGQALDKNKICCGMAKERIDYIDSQITPVRKQGNSNGAKDDIIFAYVKKYGLSSFKDEAKQEEFRQRLAERAPQVRPRIVVEPVVHNFGKVSQAKGVVSTMLALKNEGKAPLVINNLSTSCGCTTASIVYKGIEGPKFTMPGHSKENPTDWSVSIAYGDKAYLKIYYDPNMHKNLKGPITRTVSIFSNDSVDFIKEATIKLEQVE